MQKALTTSDAGVQNTMIDRVLRVVLAGQGPQLVSINSPLYAGTRRLSAKMCYTRGFATMVIRQLLLARGRLRQTRRALGDSLDRGNCWANLLPQNRQTWNRLVEDIWSVPYVQQLLDSVIQECAKNLESLHLSIDCTVRVLRRAVGQEDFIQPLRVRSAAPIPDEQALRRVLTVVGRTGALAVAECLPTENADHIAEAMRKHLSQDQRLQCQFLSSDAPSAHMLTVLKEVLPNLTILVADPVHLPINYE